MAGSTEESSHKRLFGDRLILLGQLLRVGQDGMITTSSSHFGLRQRNWAPPLNARPAGTLMDLGRGRSFGAYTFSSGGTGRLSGRP